jgi:hypothetical protein
VVHFEVEWASAKGELMFNGNAGLLFKCSRIERSKWPIGPVKLPKSRLASSACGPPLAIMSSSFLSTEVSTRLTKKLATEAKFLMGRPFLTRRSSAFKYASTTCL